MMNKLYYDEDSLTENYLFEEENELKFFDITLKQEEENLESQTEFMIEKIFGNPKITLIDENLNSQTEFMEVPNQDFDKMRPKDIKREKNYTSSQFPTGDITDNNNNDVIINPEETDDLFIDSDDERIDQNFVYPSILTHKVSFQVTKKGRKNKNNGLVEVNEINNSANHFKNHHSKIDKDNLIRKVRIYLIKFAKDLLNDCIKKDFGTKKIQQIKGVVQELTSDITISFNIEFFNSTLERIFSNPLNKKYKKMDEAHNINEIKKIKQNINKASLTNELLNKTLLEVYDWFIQKDNYEYFYDRYGKGENTYNLKEFLNTLKNKESDDYIKELEKEGMKLIESFEPTKARKVQKKRKIKFKGTNFEGYY